ncbi:MAG TPA: TlpA disulfide reductase family protein [Bacteroidia bacterium]|nr:TlpA disulfide reductase family protein [Bacteroidia bacterium]
MKRTFSLFALAAVLLGAACNGTLSGDHFEVAGTLADYPNGKVYLDKVLSSGFVVVDSSETDGDGKFSLKHPVTANGLFTLRLSNNQSLLLDPGKDKLTVIANAGQLNAGTVTGNAATASLQAFSKVRNTLRSEYGRESRSLTAINRAINPIGWQYQEARADRALKAYREYVRAYADTVAHPELAWYAASNLSIQGDFYYLQQFVERHRAKGENSEFLDYIETETQAHGDFFLAFEATDFISGDVNGDSLALSSHRGRVTYLYVWASYCGLSRMEAQRLAAWRHAHPDVPIDILTFSIDEDDKAWRQALVEDSLDWQGQIRGLNSWSSPEIAQFEVENIPVSFLIDAKGIIRSKNITAMDLERDYEEIVKKWGEAPAGK